ncbi:hypothetical protein MHBO_000081 [Bonamia ostreae]|uniref:protein-serine/threonine phosphatase n=1 Tax=Bonamia ostreae TaxID=126728 RepID=A0ABV2AEC3_9EUKA
MYYKTKKDMSPRIPTDAAKILKLLRKNVLKNVNVVFSGLFPIDETPEKQSIWKLAKMFGARCSDVIDSSVTHLVARNRATEKVNFALSLRKIKVVESAWLFDCTAHFRKVSEKKFALEPSKSSKTKHKYVRNYVSKSVSVKHLCFPFTDSNWGKSKIFKSSDESETSNKLKKRKLESGIFDQKIPKIAKNRNNAKPENETENKFAKHFLAKTNLTEQKNFDQNKFYYKSKNLVDEPFKPKISDIAKFGKNNFGNFSRNVRTNFAKSDFRNPPSAINFSEAKTQKVSKSS